MYTRLARFHFGEVKPAQWLRKIAKAPDSPWVADKLSIGKVHKSWLIVLLSVAVWILLYWMTYIWEVLNVTAATSSKLSLKPLADRVVVKKLDAEEKTAGGIVLPDTAKEKPQQGEILAVGPGKFDEKGNRQPMEVKVGDKVLFAKYSGTEVKIDGQEYLIMAERDILAITG